MDQLLGLGFSRALAELALRLNHGDVNQAIDFCIENGEESVKLFECHSSTTSSSTQPRHALQSELAANNSLGLSPEELDTIISESVENFQSTGQISAFARSAGVASLGEPVAGNFADADDWQEQLAIMESRELAQNASTATSNPEEVWEEIPAELLLPATASGAGSNLGFESAATQPTEPEHAILQHRATKPVVPPRLDLQSVGLSIGPTVIPAATASESIPESSAVGNPYSGMKPNPQQVAQLTSTSEKKILNMSNLKVKPLTATGATNAAGLSTTNSVQPNFLPQMQQQHSQMAPISSLSSLISGQHQGASTGTVGKVSFLQQCQQSYGVGHRSGQTVSGESSRQVNNVNCPVESTQSYSAARQEQLRSKVEQHPTSFTYRRPNSYDQYSTSNSYGEYQQPAKATYSSGDGSQGATYGRHQAEYYSSQPSSSDPRIYQRHPPASTSGIQQQHYDDNANDTYHPQQYPESVYYSPEHSQYQSSPMENSRFSTPHTRGSHESTFSPQMRGQTMDQIYPLKYPSPQHYVETESRDHASINARGPSSEIGSPEARARRDPFGAPSSYPDQSYYREQRPQARGIPQEAELEVPYDAIYDKYPHPPHPPQQAQRQPAYTEYYGAPQHNTSQWHQRNNEFDNEFENGDYYDDDRVDSDEEREAYEKRRAMQNTFASAKSEDYGEIVDESLFND